MPISSDQMMGPTQFVKMIEPNSVTQQFALNHEKFAQLANPSEFKQLKPHLVEVDISQQMTHLSFLQQTQLPPESFIEVSVPVLGLTDFLANSTTWNNFSQQFPVPLAVNQFGAPETPNERYFPKADYIVVKDLLGNEFELFVNADGSIDVPEQGTGRFSIITEVTYIFSAEQILDGQGLHSLKSVGAESGKLYLLPPPGEHESFKIHVTAAHLDNLNQKVLDQTAEVCVVQIDNGLTHNDHFHVAINHLSSDQESILQVDLDYLKKNYHGNPFMLSLSLQNAPGVNYALSDTHSNWNINAEGDTTVLSKQIGLSEYGLTALVRNVFSEYDFTRSLFSGETFGISHEAGFNDFGLFREAIGLYYDLFIAGLVAQTLPGEWLLQHVPNERFANLNLDYALLDEHDQFMVGQIVQDAKEGHYDTVAEHFYQPNQSDMIPLHETLYVEAPGMDSNFIPDASLSTHAMGGSGLTGLFSDQLSLLEKAIQDVGTIQSEINLLPGHEAMIIHYSDLVQNATPTGAVIKGFDLNSDKLNLCELIHNNPGISKESIRTEVDGQDIHIVATNTKTGEDVTVATLAGIAHQHDQLNELLGQDSGGRHFIELGS